MIESLSLRLANHIKSVVPEHPASVAVMKHALAIGINMVLIVILTLTTAIMTGHMRETIVIMIVFAILRQMTGGYHLKSGVSCIVVSTVLLTALSFVTLDYTLTMASTGASMLLILLLAPAGIERQSKIPKRFYPALKWSSFVLVGLNLIVASPLIAVAVLAQSVTLIIVRR